MNQLILKQMRGYITFLVEAFEEEQEITAHYSQIYAINGHLYWNNYQIISHPLLIEGEIQKVTEDGKANN